jgi:hypothetical protein
MDCERSNGMGQYQALLAPPPQLQEEVAAQVKAA